MVSTQPSVQTPSWKVKALQGVSTLVSTVPPMELQVPLKGALAKQLFAQSTGFKSPASTVRQVDLFQSDLHPSSPLLIFTTKKMGGGSLDGNILSLVLLVL